MVEVRLPDATVEKIMTKNPATLDRNDTLDLADDIMSVGRIRHMPVIEEGNVVGISASAICFGRRWSRRWDLVAKRRK
jgi:CBS domain-containing protein